jgi:hypothetical protein
MKRTILILLLVLGLCASVFGASGVDQVDNPAAVDTVTDPASVDGVTMAVPGFCSSCTGTSGCDVVCEDADGSTSITGLGTTAQCDTWTVVEPGNSEITIASQIGISGCTTEGSYMIDILADDNDGNSENSHIIKDITDSDDMFVEFFLYIEDSSEWDDAQTELVSLVCFMEATNDYLACASLFHNASSPYNKYIILSLDGTNWAGITIGGPIADDTWYRVGLKYERNTTEGAAVYWDTSPFGSWDLIDDRNAPDKAVTHILIGSSEQPTGIFSNDSLRFYIDGACFDDDTLDTTACSN